MPRSHPSKTSLCPSAAKISARLLLSLLILSPALVQSTSTGPYGNAAPVDGGAVQIPVIPGDIIAPGPVIGGGGGSREKAKNEYGGLHEFSLRHILHHGTYQYPEMLRRKDIHPGTLVATEENKRLTPRPVYTARSQNGQMARLKDRSRDTIEGYIWAQRQGIATSYSSEAWTTEEAPLPNITDKATVLALAKIAADAYIQVERTEDWLEVGTPYNLTDDFGWEGDGLRGHIFADQDNSTVIIGLKGTSPAVFDGAETTTNDKVNDNLFFSCCCARISFWWSTVCDCYSGTAYTCDQTCLGTALRAENRYYRASLQLYYNVTQMYPDANIWVIGHSLGGAVSSMLGQTYNLPVVTYEAPGEALASERLGLPAPPDDTRQSSAVSVWHFGHTADPIFMGTCNGPTSACSIGGYAMETRCHAGMTCTYDVVSDRGWRMGLGYHRIQGVIKDVIETYDTVPECKAEPDCVDCFNWKYIDGNQTTTTSSSSSTTSTATTTCHTPGWWGCRDETTTTTTTPTTTSPTSTSSSSSSSWSETCSKYGWFGGCIDPIPTTTTVTTPVSAVPTGITAAPTQTGALSSSMSSTTNTCSHKGWFGGCNDPTPTAATAAVEEQEDNDRGHVTRTECVEWSNGWFWRRCQKWKTTGGGGEL